jgi:hypothetical protein
MYYLTQGGMLYIVSFSHLSHYVLGKIEQFLIKISIVLCLLLYKWIQHK